MHVVASLNIIVHVGESIVTTGADSFNESGIFLYAIYNAAEANELLEQNMTQL